MRVSFGVGALERAEDEIAALGFDKVMVVGTGSARAPVRHMGALLQDRQVAVISSVRPHVPIEDVGPAVELYNTSGADGILAIGGGSAIGLAKAIAHQTGAVIVAVPTTYSGSEMTAIHGTTDAAGKQTGRDEQVRPRAVVYDPELTVTLPAQATAASGMNAFAHCIEALYAPDGSPLTDLAATDGVRRLVPSLPVAVREPADLDARSEALLGAFFGGWALDATTMGLHHRICHVLGGNFGISHGLANAVMLPYVTAFNAPAAVKELAPLEELLGADASKGLIGFVASLGLPTRLPEIGFARRDVEAAASLVARTPISAPRPVTESDIAGVLAAACGAS